ncbi:MAG TPA: cyclic 2,3-diphosphoglycerate synthetase [Actinomycetota bacterium]|nr:cyclic 2,3-diphosphoglycerate synthetase [Actinomycetota bacterium]
MRTLALVDGEHHPPVMRAALDEARGRGHTIVAALLVGGTEKLAAAGPPDLGVPVVEIVGEDRMQALRAAIGRHRPDVILDLSDEPVLGYRERMELAAVALVAGVPYVGADFRLEPPPAEPPVDAPTLAVIGTGKRTGKTAIAGAAARLAGRRGLEPVMVAMGRGGPPEPTVVPAGSVDLDHLLGLVAAGEHAASDYLEDALTTGVTTVGARRAGGGLAGAPYLSNVREAAEAAASLRPGLVVLEGSGAAIPPVAWDAGVLVVPASVPPEYLGGYLGPYRLLRSDLVVVTMATGPSGPENLSALRSLVRRYLGDASFIATDFAPVPLADVRGRDAFFATTASPGVVEGLIRRLEADHGCRVVGWSARLADRAGLAEDLGAVQGYDVLLTELKAAAVDTGVAAAIERGAEVVFVDNRAEATEGSVDLDTALGRAIDLARARANDRR